MKKSVVVFLIAMLATVQVFAQGIQFFDGSYEEALKLAKKQKKAIFIDVYTSWCGPCKMMAKNVFTDREVGGFFNYHFVNMKLDAEKQKDSGFFKKYQAGSFPSYFWINANGELLHTAGGYMPAPDFIKLAKEAMNSDFLEKSKALKKRWDNGERSVDLLNDYVYGVIGKTAPDKINGYVLDFLSSKDDDELKSEDIYPVVMATISRGLDNSKYSRLTLENANIYKNYKDQIPYWERMYRAIVRTAAIKHREGEKAFEEHMGYLNSMRSPHVAMYKDIIALEQLMFAGKFAEAIPAIQPLVKKYGTEHSYLYKQLFYTLMIADYFKSAPVVKEQIEQVRKVAENAMQAEPCKECLMYIAATYMKEGNQKQAYDCLASLPFFPMPMLSNALYPALGIKFFGVEYR